MEEVFGMSQYLTAQRKELISFFEKNTDKQFSAKEILDQLKDKAITLSSVYRNLIYLEEKGFIRRCIKDYSNEAYFQYMHSPECSNSIHLTCAKCGKIFHLDEKTASDLTDAVKNKYDFEITRPKTIISGICKSCKNNQ